MKDLLNNKHVRIDSGKKFTLSEFDSSYRAGLPEKKELIKQQVEENGEEIAKLQEILYADNRYSLLLVLQAMDASGKDSCIRHVMRGVNPQGCAVHSFKAPSGPELEHDFSIEPPNGFPNEGKLEFSIVPTTKKCL